MNRIRFCCEKCGDKIDINYIGKVPNLTTYIGDFEKIEDLRIKLKVPFHFGKPHALCGCGDMVVSWDGPWQCLMKELILETQIISWALYDGTHDLYSTPEGSLIPAKIRRIDRTLWTVARKYSDQLKNHRGIQPWESFTTRLWKESGSY